MDIPWDGAQLFLTVAEAGSLSAAARKLRMTQPTMSRKLAELESVLREPLFERDRSGVVLTDFPTREETLKTARIGVVYTPLRNIDLSLSYERGDRRSNQLINNFDYESWFGSLRLRF